MVIKYIRKLLGGRKKAKAEGSAETGARGAAGPHQPAVHHRPIPPNLIDPDAAKIVRRLRRFSHTAYIVGGGVRDLLLERTPKDFDISTSARPNEVRKLFRNCRIIGRRFRLAHIFFHDKIIEVATFRSNQAEDIAAVTEPGVHQEQFTRDEGDLLIRSDNVFGTPETDALRRDFTINALFYDIDTGNVIDYVGGIPDLDAHLLRMIGDPDIRLREDPIRILRAVRLAGRLGFTIDPATRNAIHRHRAEIRRAAAPRVLEDFLRIFRKGGAERAMHLMHEMGVDEIVMPELLHGVKPADFELAQKLRHALDLATGRGTEFSNATLLALVYYPHVRRVLDASTGDGENESGYAAIDKIVSGFEQRLVVPKRDRDRIRLILLAQRRLALGGRSARRPSPAAFVRKPFFPEAFDLFDIITSATGENREELRRWKSLIGHVAEATDGVSLGPHIPRTVGADGGRDPGRRDDTRGRRRRGRSDRDRAREQTGSPGRSGEARKMEPLVIPRLAPGENPYGDAVLVVDHSAAPSAADEGFDARHPSLEPVWDDQEPQPAQEAGRGGTGKAGGAPDEGGADPASPASNDASAGRRRRRRRGGRGRGRKGRGGSGESGGAGGDTNGGPAGDAGDASDDGASSSPIRHEAPSVAAPRDLS